MATAAATHSMQEAPHRPTLFLALELGAHTWKLGFTTEAAQRPRERRMPAGAIQILVEEIARAKQRFGVPEDAPGQSCDEAGRDGFWLHHFLGTQGVKNQVVDAASMEVNRRHRRAQSDRLDVRKLLTRLLRHGAGEPKVWSVVRVPSEGDADRRQLHRELLTAQRERTRMTKRMKGLLAGVGVRMALQGEVETQLEQVRQWDGAPLPAALQARLQRTWQQVCFLTPQIMTLEAERREVLRTRAEPVLDQVRQLATLRGIGVNSAW